MLLTLTLTPSLSSPILEENAVGVRNDTFTCTAGGGGGGGGALACNLKGRCPFLIISTTRSEKNLHFDTLFRNY